MGSTYLDLTNKVLKRLNEVEITSSDFASVRGIQAAAKDAVLDTVREINSQKFEWPFNATEGTQVLDVGEPEYTWPADFRAVDWSSFTLLNDGTLNTATAYLQPINKDEWYRFERSNDLDHSTDGLNKPKYVFETWNGGFGVTPVPNEQYTVKFRYWIKTIDLVTYDDTTTIPTEYDHVITDGAMEKMYTFLDNDERARKLEDDFRRGLSYMSYILIPKDLYAYKQFNVGGWPKGVSIIGGF